MSKGDPDTPPAGSPTASPARRSVVVAGAKGDAAREARIKAALKANIARRKAQARLRGEGEETG